MRAAWVWHAYTTSGVHMEAVQRLAAMAGRAAPATAGQTTTTATPAGDHACVTDAAFQSGTIAKGKHVRISRGLAVLATTAALVAGGVITGTEAQAATCYGGAQYLKKPSPNSFFPIDNGGWLKTSSRCSDINIKLTSGGGDVKWCWETGYHQWKCADTYKYASKNTWKVLATNVKDGTLIKIQFKENKVEYRGWVAS